MAKKSWTKRHSVAPGRPGVNLLFAGPMEFPNTTRRPGRGKQMHLPVAERFWHSLLKAPPFRFIMNIFSLTHLTELAKQLPDPMHAKHPVIRLPLAKWDAIRDADHPAGEFEDHLNPFVEFEIVNWKNIKGISARRWVLRGLVAM
jgi:hypothetical protein